MGGAWTHSAYQARPSLYSSPLTSHRHFLLSQCKNLCPHLPLGEGENRTCLIVFSLTPFFRLPPPFLSLSLSPHSSSSVYLVNHGLGDRLLVSNTDSDLRQLPISSEASHTTATPTSSSPSPTASPVEWRPSTSEEQKWGLRLSLLHDKVRELMTITSQLLSHGSRYTPPKGI